jgi:hypothetical protein
MVREHDPAPGGIDKLAGSCRQRRRKKQEDRAETPGHSARIPVKQMGDGRATRHRLLSI